jgi:hypothetical protein
MMKDTGAKQLGPSTAEPGPLRDDDFRTIPILFARIRQTVRAPGSIFSLIPML